ncbi:MAG: acyl carrier protein [Bacteroidetes bacterium 4572_77]|nr:MAG: acyl carrier protein [Bacteroidetes bacterium 4572_77]
MKIETIIMETISKLSDIDASEMSLNSSFEELNIDPLELAEIIMALEDRLFLTANECMYQAKTVGELAKQLLKQLIRN